MFYYKKENYILFSEEPFPFEEISEDDARNQEGLLYALHSSDPLYSRRSFAVSSPQELFLEKEDLHLLQRRKTSSKKLPTWLIQKIKERKVTSINTNYPTWEQILNSKTLENTVEGSKILLKNWRVHVVGLGDVGGTLVTGLRLLSGEKLSGIGLYDKDENKMARWFYETEQILSGDPSEKFPTVFTLKEEELFDCDLFVFCVSLGVPLVEKESTDVRMVQYEGNGRILSHYAKLARKHNYQGLFAVVSDPVDLLCNVAFKESNKNEKGQYDFKGLAPEQIRGYGLGVMHARASFYAKQKKETAQYLTEGRVFGPHGEGLVVVDSVLNYNEVLSSELTEKTKKANLEIRARGFKPYIAPALSSGALSLLATINSKWHYSATFMGGIFMGARNILLPTGTELETHEFPESLYTKLENSYQDLQNFESKL